MPFDFERRGKVVQLDYDTLAAMDNENCCVCISRRSLTMIIEVSETYHWLTRYHSVEGAEVDEDLIDAWASELELQVMTGLTDCGSAETIPLTRWNSEGELERSTNGGVTWIAFPDGDPRQSGNMFGPLPLAAGNTTRCAAAENIVANFEAQIDQYADKLQEGTTVFELILAIDAGVIVFTGFAGALAFFIAAFAAELLALGESAVRSAFDSEVWDRLKCNLDCNVQSDGTFTAANITSIHDQINEDELGVTVILLNQMIDTLGPVGMTNAGRIGGADGDTCESCDCGEYCVAFDDTDEYDLLGYTAYYGEGTGGTGSLDSGDGDPTPCLQSVAITAQSGNPGYAIVTRIDLPSTSTVNYVSLSYKYHRSDVDATSLDVDYWSLTDGKVGSQSLIATEAQDVWHSTVLPGPVGSPDVDYIVVAHGGDGGLVGGGAFGKIDSVCVGIGG